MLPRQEVISLPLAPYLRSQLVAAGYRTLADLDGLSAEALSQEAGISAYDASEVIRVSSGWLASPSTTIIPGAVPASDVYKSEKQSKRIITFCSELDKILGGGLPTGHVTEFCGVPGVGKTQLGIQLAVDVQMPTAFNGLDGAAIYIDTEGSFMIERVMDIAMAATSHINAMAAKSGKPNVIEEASRFTVDRVLNNIIYFRAHDWTEQVALVHMMEQLLQHNPKVKLIVVDSVTFHFRQDFKDMAQRTRILTGMAQELMRLAERHGLAVVFMNHVTTKVLEDNNARLIPALGESWGHAASTRVILHWQNNERYAHVYKSPSHPPGTAHYLVTEEGIRGKRPQRR